MIIGLIGLILLAIGWIYETFIIIKEKKSKINTKFAIMYVIGSGCLVIYSIQIKDMLFMILNGLITISSLVSLIYSVQKKK